MELNDLLKFLGELRKLLFFLSIAWFTVGSCEHNFSIQTNTKKTNTPATRCILPPKVVSSCDYPLCKLQPDWQDDMNYYYEENSGLHISWSPLSHTSNLFVYTVFLKWGPKCCNKLEKVSSPVNRTRDLMHKNLNVTIWVIANYSNESCVTTKNITILPRKIEKCPSPFNVNTQQLFNKLIITWESPQNIVQYELQYKEAMQRTSSWIPVSVEMKAFNVTIPDVNPTASYMVRIRCIPKNNRCTVCLWTEETSVPYKLTKKLTILENTTKEISQGKRSLFLTWETCETKHTIGYFIHIKRIPGSFHGIISLNIKKTSLNLNLSMAAYNIKITAYNEHGNSSSVTYRVPDFMSTYSDLPGHIIISNQQNYTIITWNLKYNPDCLAIDWGTGTADMKSKCLCQNETSVILDNLQPYQLYKVMLHTLDRQSKDLMKDERTLAMANFYAVEGVPRIGPANVTITVVDKHSAIVKWTEIPTKDCLGFLLEYRIYCTKVANNISWAVTLNSSMKQHLLTNLKANTHYTVHISGITRKGEGAQSQPQDFTTLKYDQGEFEGMVVSLCLGLIIIPAITIAICSLLLKRSRKLCWPPVPNPRDSSAMQVAEKTFPVALLRPSLQPLLPSVPLNEANKLYVIKDDLEAFPQQMFLSTSPATGRVSTEYSEAIVGQKEGTLPKPHKRVNASEKAKGGLHLDYVGMEFSHKAMQKFPENLPMKTVHL
ncbi:interleukin-6 receptor subunit beta-like [Crotalus tigris]|uniref:interleukin-6 receptor subunit beta-like n=1 Tax=Crotalus tigris TaxID=88082 RepID=UPI00192F427E|nr:interleukin-6 receptor subunit beta-like [Crotalus tigris]